MKNNEVKKIIEIAIPSVIDDSLIVLIGLIDTFMVSKLGSAAITSIGIINQPRLFIFSAFTAMQICISILVARKIGENNKYEGNEIFLIGLIYVIIFSIILSLIFIIIAKPFMLFCGANNDTINNSIIYFRIIMIGLVFNTVYYYINAVERGCGNTKLTLRTNIVSCIVNIMFNYLLIEGKYGFPRLEVRGAAIATVLGTIAASIYAFINLFRKNSFINIGFIISNKILIKKENLLLVIRNWWSIFIDQILTRVGFMIQSAIAARMGTLDYAVNYTGMLFLSFAFSFGNGISTAALALVGSSIGAKDILLAKKYSSASQKISLCVAFLISIVLILFGGSLFNCFFNDEYSLNIGKTISLFLAVIIPIAIYKISLTGIVRSGGDNKYVMWVSIMSNTIGQPIIAFLLIIVLNMGIYGAFIGVFASQFIAMILILLRYKSEKWIKINL